MAADRQLFEDGLRLLYGAHRQGAAQAARNGETSTLPKLKRMVRAGAKQNLAQAERLERVFALVGATPYARHDAGMQGICDTNEGEVARRRGAAKRDLINIAYGQVAAHFYLARYGTLRSAARALGHADAAKLLDRTMVETRTIDRAFTRLHDHLLARRASAPYPGESALATTAALHPALTAAAALCGLAATVALIGRGKARPG
ncbi:DUF892 family protein [Lichenibacterium minor]|nr:DUF892 family protein [Lichenibacterium minor]